MTEPAVKKLNDPQFLDNLLWKKETFLNGEVVIHTISNEKLNDQVAQKLQEKNYKLIGVEKNQSVTIKNKNFVDATEIQEVHLEKVKITEGSIVSHTNAAGKKQKVIINEGEPLHQHHENENEAKLPANLLTSSDFKKIENEKYVFRQEIARKKNSFFFRAKDGANLYKLGSNFYDAYKDGTNHFSFFNLQNEEAQKRSILGIASFIHYQENLRILILSPSLDHSIFSSFRADGESQSIQISQVDNFEYEVINHEGLFYLDISDLREKIRQEKIKDQVYLMKNLLIDYDVVLFDLPGLQEIKSHYDTYFPVLQNIQNVSFIVDMGKSTFSEIDSLREFFDNYKVKINGVIIKK